MAQDLNDLEIYVTIMPHKNICATFVPQKLNLHVLFIFSLFDQSDICANDSREYWTY